MDSIILSNKQTVPVLGLGTWRIEEDTATKSVESAILAGYRHIDCAMAYGNEKGVGAGIKRAIEQGHATREELFVTSKLWNTDHDPKHVEEACRKTLSDLGLKYLDLYLMHWGVAFEHGEDLEPLDENGLAKFSFVPLQQTWQAMEALVDKGLVKSIGVANFSAPMLIDVLSYAKIRPVMNQIELHPYHAQDALIKFCSTQGVAVTAYSPLGSSGAPILEDESIAAIATKHNKTAAQVALRWALHRGTIVIPRSSHEDRIAENFDVFNFELSTEEMQTINKLDKRRPLVDPLDWWGFPYF